MITSKSNCSDRCKFEKLLQDLDVQLNESEKPITQDQWENLSGELYEDELIKRLQKFESPFEFEKTSIYAFPDIVVRINEQNKFGVEAKTTKSNKWKTTGSSILESTRISDLHSIYLSFAKLGGEVAFKTRLYEECLSDVAVTHSPRYLINMELSKGESIFDRINVSYDEVSNSSQPFDHFKRYYTESKKGDSYMWWTSEDINEPVNSSPLLIRHFSDLSKEEKDSLIVEALIRYPDVLMSGGKDKYKEVAVWLIREHSIVPTCLRDSFTAGGQIVCDIPTFGSIKLPAVFAKLNKLVHREDFLAVMQNYKSDSKELKNWLDSWSSSVINSANSYKDNVRIKAYSSFLIKKISGVITDVENY